MHKEKSCILFITRKYPPAVGGMENYAYNLYKLFSKHHICYKISLGKKQTNLIWFIPWSLVYGFFLCSTKRITHIHIGDAVLSPIGILLKKFFKIRLSITVYGLDLVYKNPFYQLIIKKFLPKYPTVICISRATKEICVSKGVDKNRCHVIPCAIDTNIKSNFIEEDELIKKIKLKLNVQEKKILLTVGRLVKRKGVKWFIENVFIHLPDKYVYVVVGDGPEFIKIKKSIEELKITNRVFLLGRVSENIKFSLYSIADIFIMPNIKVANDLEGFGIVALEAGLYNVPVVASNIDGIKDAVINNVTGILVPERDTQNYINAIIMAEKIDRKKISFFIKKYYNWERVYKNYKKILKLS